MATKSKPASSGTTTKPPRKPKGPAMTLAQRLALAKLIEAADPAMPDAALAKLATEKLGRTVSRATATTYRKELGIASVKNPTQAELIAMVETLKEQVAIRDERITQLMAEQAEAATA